jgi:hypothetical protein
MRFIKTINLLLIGLGLCGCDSGGFWPEPEPTGRSLLDGAIYPYTGTWEWDVGSDACDAEVGLLAASDGVERADARQDLYDLESYFVDAAGNEVLFEGHVVHGEVTGTLSLMDPATGHETSAVLTAVVVTDEAPHVIEGVLSEFVGADCAHESIPITIRVLQ